MDMTNAELLREAELTWRYVGPGQENLTYDRDRDLTATYAELYTEDGELLVAMKRVPEMKTRSGVLPSFWSPHHSELLSQGALDAIPSVETIDELDMHMILDLETEDARRAS